MITRILPLAIGTTLLAAPFIQALSASEIDPETPIANLVSSAKAHLASGNAHDALTYFDAAIHKDPKNYLTIFQRGAAYLSLGNTGKASRDFDNALLIRPDFEGALLQRAKIKSRNADWSGARADYEAAKKTDSEHYAALNDAERAAQAAVEAEKANDWESCIREAGTATYIASESLQLRQIRSKCRLERGEVLEAMNDLQHILKLSPSSIDPHMQISNMMFFAVGDRDRGIEQLKRCLRSDPDSRACSKLLRREKNLNKAFAKLLSLQEKKGHHAIVKLLLPHKDEPGLLAEVKDEVKEAKEAGYIHPQAPNALVNNLVDIVCEAYLDMNNKAKAQPFCTEALEANQNSIPGLIHKAERQIDAEEYEPAIATLNQAHEHHQSSSSSSSSPLPDPSLQARGSKIQSLLQRAHKLLKRSKSKDYYKVLEVSTDADELAIKRAYRRKTKIHHPDKAASQGIHRDEAQKKMQEINEAYEVLSDPELRARFDNGDDPNNPEQQHGGPFQGSPFGQGGGGGQQFFFQQGGGGGGGQGGFKFAQGGGGGGGGFQFPGGGFGF